jgi:Xaa-Pro aminopeptidase
MFLYDPVSGQRHLLVDNFWDVIGRPEEEQREREQFHLAPDLGAEVARLLSSTVRRLGLVGARYMPAYIERSLREALPTVEIVDASAQLNAVREVKSDEEIDWLRFNAALSDAAANAFLAAVRPGVSEKEVADEALHAARRAGADGFWTPISVASGPRTALYYALPTGRVLQAGEAVHMDCGVMAGGYHGDIQRGRILAGDTPQALHGLARALVDIQDELVQDIRPGWSAGHAAEEFARLADDAGMGQYLHAHARGGKAVVGHGIGSDGHESPDLYVGSSTPLREGMVVTLEPMLFIPGVGGAGIEDMLLITARGGQRLTQAPRNLE